METTCSAMSELLSLTMTMQGEAGDIWNSGNNTSTSSSVRPDVGQPSLFRLDGQVILPPLMTSAKKREAQLARQRATQLEEQRQHNTRRSHSMASPRSGLSQTQTYIYDSTRQGQQQQQQQRRRPQTLGFDVPTIQVNPPTPLLPMQTPTLPLSPERRLKPNKITERIQQFEQTGIGGHIGQILRSSTSPALAEKQLKPQVAKPTPPPETVTLQRSRSFTLEEPSPALVENMRRQGYSPNFQRETIESQAKRVVRQPSPTNPNPNTSNSRKVEEREREIERMIELVMNKYGLVEARRRGWVRQYLRGHREPMDRLMEYQETERRRMQAAFEEQQRQLIEQLCAQLENPERTTTTCSSSSRHSDDSSSSNSSTASSATTASTSRTITLSTASPRHCHELDGFLAANSAPPASAARKCLFSPHPGSSLGYESEPQLLGESSTAPSTPRSLPLRNSSLTNSRRQATGGASGAAGAATKSAPGRRSQSKASGSTKSMLSARGGAGATGAGANANRRKTSSTMASPKKSFPGKVVTPPAQKRGVIKNKQLKPQVAKPTPPPETVTLQRSRSFTLEEPSPALVENMRRQGYSPNFQRETIESQAKRVVRQPSPTNPNPNTSNSRKVEEREREIERMIELVMNKYGLVEARRRGWVRQYLRGHREPMDRLMEYQETERRRMQAAFEEQQRQLIEQLCAQLENPERTTTTCSSSSRHSDDSSSSNSSTASSATTASTSRTITLSTASPRHCHELDGFLAANSAPPASAARKCLFSPHPGSSLGYESEPQLLGESSTAPSTPRSLPLRNSSLTNSRRQATGGASGAAGAATKSAPGRRSQSKASGSTKSMLSARGGAGATGAGANANRRKTSSTMASPKKSFPGKVVTPPAQKRGVIKNQRKKP
ncbi:autotransporter adhesin BpaC isoform X2 [Drosophila kikkawai]|uniref:Autotransporter adhesin BpaC isoform X2 n=1 Tax=Drosophila kikkawai TaxID=30033 RepID=A0ABM3C573_DROKI|nr:uncharacterized protein LOC108079787 isoform X2 [Drosophila kikkawai]